MTNEDFELLKPFEEQFERAQSDWVKNEPNKHLELLERIYVANAETKPLPLNYNCSGCILGLFKRLGALYFKKKAEIANAKVLEQEEQQTKKKLKGKQNLKTPDSKNIH